MSNSLSGKSDETASTAGAPSSLCAGPVAPGARPSFDVPAGACDCHAHVFGGPPLYPYREPRRYTPAPSTDVRAYAGMLHSIGIERAVLVQPDIYTDNRLTIDGVAALRGLGIDARGIVLVDLDVNPDTIAKLNDAGIRGVRIHLRQPWPGPQEQAGALRRLDALAERIAPFGWHMQCHVKGSLLPGLRTWLASLPVQVVLDHFGRVDLARGSEDASYRTLLELLGARACWVKLSAANRFDDPRAPYPTLAPPVRDLIAAAPGQLLWGSDWPHSSFAGVMPSDAALLDVLASWTPDPDVLRRILVDNPARLYGF